MLCSPSMAGDGDENDVDRAAILARRQKFIALALSGLAATLVFQRVTRAA